MSIQDLDSHTPELSVSPNDGTKEKSASSSSSQDPSPSSTDRLPKSNLCGVCNAQPSKYKCPRCLLPYCSLQCSTQHKPTHPPLPPPSPPQSPAAPAPSAIPRAGTLAAKGFKGPFAGLEDSSELRMLFKRYPRLAEQLEAIHAATLPGDGERWTRDRGVERGVRALGRARAEEEGVREFAGLVLRVVEGQEGIWREEGEEDVRVVERLLRGEM